MAELTGLVCGMERFAIHDGPGIRTLVYMKGCPLSCLWCSSPHTQRTAPEVLHDELKCQKHGGCVKVCPPGAISLSEEEGVVIDRELCDACGKCVDACRNRALEIAGEPMTVEGLLREVEKDSPFYRRSNGGVTVGGGEPTMQHEFVARFLENCRQRYLHAAMETCGYVAWKSLEKLLEYLDLLYFDIKHMDGRVHRELTGYPNKLILENARRASVVLPMIIRIPVVPGYNDSEDNIAATARFAAELGDNVRRVELLPYHKFGTQNYRRLGRQYELDDVEPPDDGHMQRLKELAESCGVAVQIGG